MVVNTGTDPDSKRPSNDPSNDEPKSSEPETTEAEKDDEKDSDTLSITSQESITSIFKVSRDDGLKQIREKISALKKREDFTTEEGITELLFLLNCTPNLDTKGGRDKRARLYVEEMIANGVMDVITRVTQKYVDKALLAKKDDDLNYLCITLCLSFVMNASSLSIKICEEVQRTAYYGDMLKLLDSSVLRPENNNNYKETDGKYELWGNAVTLLLITLQICIQRLDLRENYRSFDAVRIFDLYRKCENDVFKSMGELSFACVVTEKEKDLMVVDEEGYAVFKDILSQAIENHNTPGSGGSFDFVFQPEKIIDALNQLAVNDENKQKIAEHGFLPFYIQMLNPEKSSEREMAVATKGLWLLAFKAKDLLIKEPGCVEGLKKLAESSEIKRVKDQAKGALWIIEGKDEEVQHEANKQTDSQGAEVASSGGITMEGGHVMISYQWATKPTMLRVRDKITQGGYRVWMDVDDMSGSLLDAMAEAVEKASVVIICLTQKYKESPSCRLECEYASKRRKPIVPLLLQYKYDPDGWLGIIKGTKLHFDFSNEEKFDTSVQGLLREIASLASKQNAESGAISAPVPQVALNNMCDWSDEKVAEWLKEAGLENSLEKFKGMNGESLLEYKHLMHEDPQFFNKSLETEFNLALADIMAFRKALRKV